MSTVWNKLDLELASIYLNHLHVQKSSPKAVPKVHPVVAAGGRLNVTMEYTGALAEIESHGFRTLWNHGLGSVAGTVDLSNLERLAAHPGVQKLSVGRKPRLTLNRSVPAIHARTSAQARGVWTFNGLSASPLFTGETGKNVIVGIIDSGIDFRHPFFMKVPRPGGKPDTTRILRLWDTGLEPLDGEHKPPAELLTGASYGVEYKYDQINYAIRNPATKAVRHRDCLGHGTLMASIAAGNGQPDFRYIGVAPEADLVVVKIFYPDKDPEVDGPVDELTLIKNAVTYILNVAKNLLQEPDLVPKPVVLNCSFADSLGPHDGFTDLENWLTEKFAGEKANGTALVCAAGNEAGQILNDGDPEVFGVQHVLIRFPDDRKTVTIPFNLIDKRAKKIDFGWCGGRKFTDSLYIKVYYAGKDLGNGRPVIDGTLKLPSSSDVADPIPIPALGDGIMLLFRGRVLTMLHKIDDTQNVLKRDGRTKATIKRNQLAIKVEPDTLNGHLATDLKAGQYELRVHSPGKLDVYVWCGSDLADGEYGFEIPTQIRGSHRPALDPIIEVVDMNQVGWMGGADNIVTAAASDARTAALEVASFSSRGQLVQYDTDFKRNQTKPDVAAPGVEIHGAGSQDHRPPLPGKIKMWSGNGSSAATPHITGTIALMLEKNRALTTNKIIETLTAQADKNPAPDPDEAGAGWLNAKKCVDNTPQG